MIKRTATVLLVLFLMLAIVMPVYSEDNQLIDDQNDSTPSPTATVTPSPSPTVTVTPSPSPSPTSTPSPTISPTSSPTIKPVATQIQAVKKTAVPSVTPTATAASTTAPTPMPIVEPTPTPAVASSTTSKSGGPGMFISILMFVMMIGFAAGGVYILRKNPKNKLVTNKSL